MRPAMVIAAILAATIPATGIIRTENATSVSPVVAEVKTSTQSASVEPTETVIVLDYYGTYEVERPYIPPKTTTTLADAKTYIFEECAEREIDPYIVMAMVHHESRWNAESIGDSGRAFGLMQIQPRWHEARIEKLGVDDLLDPVQNVKVGIDFFDELMDMGKGLDWALMCYNGGPAKANKQSNLNYAIKIKNTAVELAEK